MVHAENGDDVYAAQQKMIELRLTGLKGHPLSRCAVLEGEATSRAIRLYVVYVMSIDVMEEIVKENKCFCKTTFFTGKKEDSTRIISAETWCKTNHWLVHMFLV